MQGYDDYKTGRTALIAVSSVFAGIGLLFLGLTDWRFPVRPEGNSGFHRR